jgi:HD-GYP domain-containing protein (c-di-GMP phosphodiesterase class II)
MGEYKPFDFSPEMIDRFREERQIPVHFYNKDGQILIYKKEEASEAEINRLLRFVQQGIYYNTDDTDALGLGKGVTHTEEGLSDVKLLSESYAEELTRDTSELFDTLKRSTITSVHAKRSSDQLNQLFTDFESQPDAMNGLVNIIEIMAGGDTSADVELAVKRTVVAMAMKTRGMKATTFRDKQKMQDMVNVLMMSALLCDIGYTKMRMPTHDGLTSTEMDYVRNHPLMSYMMIAHERGIDTRVKRNILCHHRPLRGDAQTNNYPNLKVLLGKLTLMEQKYRDDPSKAAVAQDVREQIALLKSDLPYDEDANILAIASEFASLTSKTNWRPAHSADRAIRMIINNAFFTYTDRVVREFLDHVSMSLNDNQKVLAEGDFIVLASRDSSGKPFFEVCLITLANRYQSKPGVDRIATAYPHFENSPKLRFGNFNTERLRPDPRYAHFELSKDDSRHIVYAVDQQFDAQLYEKLTALTVNRRKHSVEAGDQTK